MFACSYEQTFIAFFFLWIIIQIFNLLLLRFTDISLINNYYFTPKTYDYY
jgi:hypothetical protein